MQASLDTIKPPFSCLKFWSIRGNSRCFFLLPYRLIALASIFERLTRMVVHWSSICNFVVIFISSINTPHLLDTVFDEMFPAFHFCFLILFFPITIEHSAHQFKSINHSVEAKDWCLSMPTDFHLYFNFAKLMKHKLLFTSIITFIFLFPINFYKIIRAKCNIMHKWTLLCRLRWWQCWNQTIAGCVFVSLCMKVQIWHVKDGLWEAVYDVW